MEYTSSTTTPSTLEQLREVFRAQLDSLTEDIASLDGVVGLHLMMWDPRSGGSGSGGDLAELYVDLYDNTGHDSQQSILDVDDGGHQATMTMSDAVDVVQVWTSDHAYRPRAVTLRQTPGDPQHELSAEFDGGATNGTVGRPA